MCSVLKGGSCSFSYPHSSQTLTHYHGVYMPATYNVSELVREVDSPACPRPAGSESTISKEVQAPSMHIEVSKLPWTYNIEQELCCHLLSLKVTLYFLR